MPGKYKLVKCGKCGKLVSVSGKITFIHCSVKQSVPDNYIRPLSYTEYVILRNALSESGSDQSRVTETGKLTRKAEKDAEVTTEVTAEVNSTDADGSNLNGALGSFTIGIQENHPNITPKGARNLRKKPGKLPCNLSAIEYPEGEELEIIEPVKRDFFGFEVKARKKRVKSVSQDNLVKYDMYGFEVK